MMLARIDEGELDGGARRAIRERRCIVTREVKPIDAMIRFVVGPDDAVTPDIKRKLPGRGVWVSADRRALAAAIERKAFARSFRRDVRAGPDLVAMIERMLERAALDALAVAHKAGLVAAGFAKTEAALASADVIAILHAAHARPDGVRKLAAAARRGGRDVENLPIIDIFTSDQLDLALGRPNVIHAALLAGPAGNGFIARFRGLERFRSDDPNVRDRAAHCRNGAP
jgi:predicted RNA-binding protein YlxR (DUF448 family)